MSGLLGITKLRNRLNLKKIRVDTRYRYYEMKNVIKDFEISTPPNLRGFQTVLGWCGKSVDSISDRLMFREFEEDNFDIKEVNPKQIDRTRIQEFLKQGDREEVVYFVEEFFRDLSNKALQSNIFRQYITMDVYFCVADFLESLQTDTQELETPNQDEKTLQDSDSAIHYITRILQKALAVRDKAASSRYDDVVEQVMKYIDENYADEELSLNLLASHVNFSPNHLSMIFSQQTGQSFIKYLTDYRMNKAKELLRCTGKRSSLISQEVGYKDPHYFSYLFKKTQGMTPTQYRGGTN